MTQVKVNATVFLAMMKVANTKIESCKNIIIQNDDLHYKILTENYAGEITLASWATHPVQPQNNGTG